MKMKLDTMNEREVRLMKMATRDSENANTNANALLAYASAIKANVIIENAIDRLGYDQASDIMGFNVGEFEKMSNQQCDILYDKISDQYPDLVSRNKY